LVISSNKVIDAGLNIRSNSTLTHGGSIGYLKKEKKNELYGIHSLKMKHTRENQSKSGRDGRETHIDLIDL
jgi:hypothetical protein